VLEKHKNFKKKNNDLPVINERIQFPEIRLIDAKGEQIGILSATEALQLAEI
jgi:translation initiation factor IF-3